MNAKKIERKSRMKPFVKYVNYNHLLPTRFMVKDDFEFRAAVTEDIMNNRETRKATLAQLKNDFQARYMKNEGAEKQANANFLFSKLRF
jgi:large subunit ribosomal protein L27e